MALTVKKTRKMYQLKMKPNASIKTFVAMPTTATESKEEDTVGSGSYASYDYQHPSEDYSYHGYSQSYQTPQVAKVYPSGDYSRSYPKEGGHSYKEKYETLLATLASNTLAGRSSNEGIPLYPSSSNIEGSYGHHKGHGHGHCKCSGKGKKDKDDDKGLDQFGALLGLGALAGFFLFTQITMNLAATRRRRRRRNSPNQDSFSWEHSSGMAMDIFYTGKIWDEIKSSG